jgi:inorganic pyrophosphatase
LDIEGKFGGSAMVSVFVQNEAGSDLKHSYNEKTLEYLGSQRVSRPYPYPYGFILGTTSEDGDNLDCFLITNRRFERGSIVRCQPIGLLEQIEDNLADHNVLAVPDGESAEISQEVVERLTDFILHVFDHVPGKSISVGRVLPVREALMLITTCSDNK